jgi:cytochrome c5
MVIALLIGITILLIIVATFVLGGGQDEARQELARKRAQENLEPVGKVRLSGEPMPEVAKGGGGDEAGDSGGEPRSGEAVVQNVCIACHQGGFQNAPAIGDAEGWKPRADKGLATLVDHVQNGFGNMPAQGGSASEEEIRRAILWMLEDETGVEVPES